MTAKADPKINPAEDLASYVRDKNLDYVKVGIDVDGVMRGKYMGLNRALRNRVSGAPRVKAPQ